ncbi:hypothetical protein [Tsuneonella suprasediminis]|uniref:hypothetical protein n=1 Tax=Tsuneonella suprasediminis TaxID=2306996 RepID=UPI002F9506E1
MKIARAKAQERLDEVNSDLARAYIAAHKAGEAVELLGWIEAHLAATGIAASGFGKNLLNDPGFVKNLREGRKTRPVTDDLVRRYLAGHFAPRSAVSRH